MGPRDLIKKRFLPFLVSRRRAKALNSALLWTALSGMGIGNYDPSMIDERRFLRRFSKALPSAPIVFDVGANHGQYAVMVLEEIPDARVYSFEPNPQAFAKLIDAIKSPHFQAINTAVGSRPGAATMFDYAHAQGSEHASLVRGVIEKVHQGQTQEIAVDVVTLDGAMAEYGVERIDLLKVDVEGFEAEVLRGAIGALAEHRIGAVQFEFNEMNIVSKHFLADFEALLPGYRLHRLLRNGELLDLSGQPTVKRELFAYQNIVALPS
jgi:FkbM family methyltransferase